MMRRHFVNRRGFVKGVASLATFAGAPRLFGIGGGLRPLLALGVISDTHITDKASTVVLERTLMFMRDRKVDAVMICGDLSDYGLLSGLKYIAETWEKVFPHGKGAGGKPGDDYPVTHARYHKNLRIVSDYGTAQKPKFNI